MDLVHRRRGFLRIGECVGKTLQRRARKPLHHVGIGVDRFLVDDETGAVEIEPRVAISEFDELLPARGFLQERLADRILPDAVGASEAEHAGQCVARRDEPCHLARIDAGDLCIGVEKFRHRAERRVRELLAFEVRGLRDARRLQHVDRVRRLGVDDGNQFDIGAIVAARKNDGGRVGEADLRRAGCHLLHGIGGPLPAHDGDVETLGLVVALLGGKEVIGVATVEAEVGDEGDIVRRPRTARESGRDQSKP